MSSEVRMKKAPAWAAILSFLPGLGQIYVGYYLAGFINIVVFVSLLMLSDSRAARDVEGPFIILTVFFWFFNIIDAVKKANHYNNEGRTPDVPTDSPLVSGIMLLVVGGFLTLGVTLDIDLEWLINIWPLFLVGAGVYMIWRYKQTKEKLETDRLSSMAREQSGGRYPGTMPPPTPGAPPHPPAGPGGGPGGGPGRQGGPNPGTVPGANPGASGGPNPGYPHGPNPGMNPATSSGSGSTQGQAQSPERGPAPPGTWTDPSMGATEGQGPTSFEKGAGSQVPPDFADVSHFGNPSAADLVFGESETPSAGPTPPLPRGRGKRPEDQEPWQS